MYESTNGKLLDNAAIWFNKICKNYKVVFTKLNYSCEVHQSSKMSLFLMLEHALNVFKKTLAGHRNSSGGPRVVYHCSRLMNYFNALSIYIYYCTEVQGEHFHI